MAQFIDISGQRFGRWIVLGRAPAKGQRPIWRCQCDCGTVIHSDARDIRIGNSRSCGCLRVDVTSNRNTKHGAARRGHQADEWYAWKGMKQRCHNPRNPAYRYYGGRGITVCDAWRESFSAFLQDIGPRPSIRHTIDRINNGGNYEPGNCRWATKAQQSNNRRGTHYVEYDGMQMTLTSLAAYAHVGYNALYRRVIKENQTPTDAVTALQAKRRTK